MSGKTWQPTEAQYQEYLAKEAEYAKRNISQGLQLQTFSPTQDLLHSKATMFAAMQALLEERPNRFERDPRVFSSVPRRKLVPSEPS